ncbi:MAG: hypothetical protein ACO4AU_11985 [bacterium]|jgi:DNA-binding response OmpR family regulator
MSDSTSSRVLLVDSGADSGSLISVVLAREGCDVNWKARWDEAILSVKEAPPNLLIMDPALLQLSALKSIRQARLIPGLEEIPILLILSKQEAPNFPMDQIGPDQDFLIRPLQHRQLFKKFRKVLPERFSF